VSAIKKRWKNSAIKKLFTISVSVISILSVSLFPHALNAAELDKPTGLVALEIVGEISSHNSTVSVDGKQQAAAVFDIAMLESLPQETIRTKTHWTEGVTEFTGVRLNVLLDHIGASSKHITLGALDEYQVEVTDGPFADYPIVVAYKRDGEYMSVRNLGPLWVMYPFDDHPELDTESSRANCVWQLNRITVH